MTSHPSPETEKGLALVPCPHGVAETVQRLEALLAAKGVRLFAKVDHAAGAGTVGLALRPTVLLIFGNPSVGTPLMQSNQTIGVDLPLHVLVWEDEAGRAWLAYPRPADLAERHGIHDRDESVKAMTAGLEGLARAATAP